MRAVCDYYAKHLNDVKQLNDDIKEFSHLGELESVAVIIVMARGVV